MYIFRPPLIVIAMIPMYKNVLIALGVILFAVVGFITMVIAYFRSRNMLKSVQLKMQSLILLGGFIGAAR
jgi:hypothetical protein